MNRFKLSTTTLDRPIESRTTVKPHEDVAASGASAFLCREGVARAVTLSLLLVEQGDHVAGAQVTE